MRYLLLVITLYSFNLNAQEYSGFYNYYDDDLNVNVNGSIDVNQNITLTKKTTTTIKTIDYAALAKANAERERNRILMTQYADNKQRIIAEQIADDPYNAFKYGYFKNQKFPRKEAKKFGFTKLSSSFTGPNKELFNTFSGPPGSVSFQNISSSDITTEISLFVPTYYGNLDVTKMSGFWQTLYNEGPKKATEYAHIKVGTISENGSYFHKKSNNTCKLYGKDGYYSELIIESDFDKAIVQDYYAISNGVLYRAKVKFYGNKNEVTFEELEGRKYYLRRLIKSVFSTAKVEYDI